MSDNYKLADELDKISGRLRNGNADGLNLSEDELLKFIWDQVKFWSEEEARENYGTESKWLYDPTEWRDIEKLEENTKEIFMKTMGQISAWAFEKRGSYPYYDEADLADYEMKISVGGS